MTRVVYVHHVSSEHDLEQFLRDAFTYKKVFADDDGRLIYQGSPVPFSFFDHHADVVVTSLPMHLHKSFAQAMPHMPTVGLHEYHGMYAQGRHREVWRDHVKQKGIKTPHGQSINPKDPISMHDLRSKVFLPSHFHVPGNDYGNQAIKTFPELQEYISNLTQPAHIERQVKGDHAYIVSIKDFRDHDIYTTPLLHKTDHGHKVCSHINEERKQEAIQFVRELHSELGLGPVAQFEFVMSKNDMYLVHVEPNPTHADNGALHAGLESVGSSMKDLWKNIITNAKKKK